MIALTLLFPLLALSAYYHVPQPQGPYGVSIEDVILIDHSLPDPYLNLSYRRLAASVISAIDPNTTCKPSYQPYLPLLSAQFWEQAFANSTELPLNGTFSETSLSLCQPTPKNASAPFLVFAPGAGVARQFYHITLSQIVAQSGYTIVSWEQPGYVEFEYFPDGSIEYGQIDPSNGNGIESNVQDVSFILDYFNVSKAGTFGHSEGGDISVNAIINETRLIGGMDWDGGFYGPILNHTSSTPFAILSSSGHNQSDAETPWDTVWANLLGDKWQIELNGSVHTTYGDYPYLMKDLYNLTNIAGPKLVDEVAGTLPAREALQAITTATIGFFEFVFGRASAQEVAAAAMGTGEYIVKNITIVS